MSNFKFPPIPYPLQPNPSFFSSLRLPAKVEGSRASRGRGNPFILTSYPFILCPLSGQRGSIAFYLILFVVLGFAIMLAGGGSRLLSGDLPSPANAPTPTFTPTPTLVPLPGSTDTPGWKITLTPKGCSTGIGYVEAKIEGKATGYFVVDVGGIISFYKPFVTLPTSYFTLDLYNADGFATKPWTVKLYEGGTQSGTTFSGGTKRAEKGGSPTGC